MWIIIDNSKSVQQIYSMMPYACSVIDRRWRRDMVRRKKCHTRPSRVCQWCSCHVVQEKEGALPWTVRRGKQGKYLVKKKIIKKQKKNTFVAYHKEMVLDFSFAACLSPSLLHKNVPLTTKTLLSIKIRNYIIFQYKESFHSALSFKEGYLPNCEEYACSKSAMRKRSLNSKEHGNCW